MTATAGLIGGQVRMIPFDYERHPMGHYYKEALEAAVAIEQGDRSKETIERASFAALQCQAAVTDDETVGDALLNASKQANAAVKRAEEILEAEAKKRDEQTDRETAAQIARSAELFHDHDGISYATITVGDHQETVAVRSRRFKNWLTLQFREAKGKAPATDALSVAQNEADALASLEGPMRSVHMRVAHSEGRVYLDLCDEQWRVVEVDAHGWRVLESSPVKFVRSADARPLPMPVQGGSLGALRPFVNAACDDDWHMMVAWLIGSLAPDGPYPLLLLYGEQGSAKSSTARALRMVVDPAGTMTRRTPKDEHDLAIAARRCHALVFDNLSSLSGEMSDAFCRLATGGGLGTRKLYTDDEESTFYAKRPVILNGIEEVATRGDLLDRALVLQLPKLEPDQVRDEATMKAEFDAAHPTILGALLSGVSNALGRFDSTRLERLPRMADFAKWVVASDVVPDFLFVYDRNRMDAIGAEIEASPFASAVLEFAQNEGEWNGTAALLLGILNLTREPAERGRNWPDGPKAVGNRLRRYAPALRSQGVEFEAKRSNGVRSITLRSAVTVPNSAV